MTNQIMNQAGSRGQWERSCPVLARTSSTRARGMIRFRARSRPRVGQDANAPASLLMSITVASESVGEWWHTHADRRLSVWQDPGTGAGLSALVTCRLQTSSFGDNADQVLG